MHARPAAQFLSEIPSFSGLTQGNSIKLLVRLHTLTELLTLLLTACL